MAGGKDFLRPFGHLRVGAAAGGIRLLSCFVIRVTETGLWEATLWSRLLFSPQRRRGI